MMGEGGGEEERGTSSAGKRPEYVSEQREVYTPNLARTILGDEIKRERSTFSTSLCS